MTLKINYFNKKIEKNFLIFCDDKLNLKGIERNLGSLNTQYLRKFISSNFDKGKNFLVFDVNTKQKIIAIKINHKQDSYQNETKGADLYKIIKSHSIDEVCLIDRNIKQFSEKNNNFLNEFLHGLELKSYQFNKYKSKSKKKIINIYLPEIFKKQINKKY